jgi:hypothetical protein
MTETKTASEAENEGAPASLPAPAADDSLAERISNHGIGDRIADDKDDEAATEGTDGDGSVGDDKKTQAIVVSSSKKSRPPYKYDPSKITLRFLFANRDGLTVTIECDPSDTVGEAKGALLSVWPKGKG